MREKQSSCKFQVCDRCLYTSYHPLGVAFSEESVCNGCLVHQEKDVIDWQKRRERLAEICSAYRVSKKASYDCIVPIDGGVDSFFTAHTLVNEFGMNPLFVSFNTGFSSKEGMYNLARIRTVFNKDMIAENIGALTMKKLARASFLKCGSFYWPCLAGKYTFPVQIAAQLEIPLIIWGCHQGVDQVGMFSHHDYVEMTKYYWHQHDLMGIDITDLADTSPEIDDGDIQRFRYPSDAEIESIGIRGIYLNNYIRWDSISKQLEMAKMYGYQPSGEMDFSYDRYSHNHCYLYRGVHDYLKYLKYGYTKNVDYVVRDIRLKHLTLEEGRFLASFYKPKGAPMFLDLFLDWLGITENSFYYLSDQVRNPLIWHRENDWTWSMNEDFSEHVYGKDIERNPCNSALVSQLKQRPDFFSADEGNVFLPFGKGC